jgi:hypothetical protein
MQPAVVFSAAAVAAQHADEQGVAFTTSSSVDLSTGMSDQRV